MEPFSDLKEACFLPIFAVSPLPHSFKQTETFGRSKEAWYVYFSRFGLFMLVSLDIGPGGQAS